MNYKLTLKLTTATLLLLFTTIIFAEIPSSATRLMLSEDSTKNKPQYFRCDIAHDDRYTTGINDSKEFVRVILVNHAQMIRKFNGLGIFDTTAEYVNHYTFETYYDTAYNHTSNAFVDAFVLRGNYQVKCEIVKGPTRKRPLAPING